MPELDGISAAAEITWRHNVPIVLLSGSYLPAHIEQLKHAQVLVRQVKPVSRPELEKVLAEVTAMSAAVATASSTQPIVKGGYHDGNFFRQKNLEGVSR
jgi:CheY-like chemotaxis protein